MRWFGVIFGILITSVFRASASKQIRVSSESVSWLSKEKLAALLRASFDAPICCNVLINGDSAENTKVFDEFVKVYPYAYTSNGKTNVCPDYFLISTSTEGLDTVMNTVPTTMASTRLLIVVLSDNAEESSGLFNISMYQDASVNIAAYNGLWTLSENILNSRIFKKVFGFHEMAYKRKFIDFQGREVQAVTVFDPPYSYLWSTVNRTQYGISSELDTEDDQSDLDGIEVKLFLLMARRLNFTWTIRRGDRYDRYGERNGTAWSGGIIGQIYEKKAEIAFSAIYTTLNICEVINMTQPWGQCFQNFAVPKPKPYRSFFALITPLSKEVWAAVLTMLVIQSIYVFGRAWIDPRISRRFRNFLVTLTELMGQLLGVWMPARMHGLKLQLYLWHLGGILLVTAYSSNLAARLARELYENKIDTIQDLAESNLTWGTTEKLNFETIFNLSDPYENGIRNRFEYETSKVETRGKIRKGNFAIIGLLIDSVFFPRDQVDDEDFQMIFCLRESGLIQFHFDHVVHRRIGSTQRELLVEKDDNEGPKVLKLTSLGVGFCILILGLSLSTIVFFLELKYFNKDLSPLEVLRQIQKNREVWLIKERRRKRRYPFFGKFKEEESCFIP